MIWSLLSWEDGKHGTDHDDLTAHKFVILVLEWIPMFDVRLSMEAAGLTE